MTCRCASDSSRARLARACSLTAAFATVFLLLAPDSEAARGTTKASARAQAARRAGFTAFDLGRYDEAVRSFERAYRLQADPRLLYNLALAYFKRHELERRRRDLVQARDLFRRFVALATPRSLPGDQRIRQARALARGYLERAERALAALATQPTSRPSTPARPIAPPVVSPPPPRPITPAVVAPDRGSRRAILPWTLYGAAAAMAIAGAITAGAALDATSDADDAARVGDLATNQVRADRADSLALATDLLIGGAAAALIAGLAIHLWPRQRRTVAGARGLAGLGFTF